ncbi:MULTISPECIES: hypothetical protein [unclassified Rhizobium]|uniref:hypothetical protein n=1 Tax=unclassified Rhizobium TaxID=2613769 RepID=UPI0018EBE649
MFSNPTFIFTFANVAAVKKALRSEFPEVGSSHADEALAASFGFKTYAAMLQVLRQVDESARVAIGVDHYRLALRLLELGYANVSPASLWILMLAVKVPSPQYDEVTADTVRAMRRPNAANSA